MCWFISRCYVLLSAFDLSSRFCINFFLQKDNRHYLGDTCQPTLLSTFWLTCCRFRSRLVAKIFNRQKTCHFHSVQRMNSTCLVCCIRRKGDCIILFFVSMCSSVLGLQNEAAEVVFDIRSRLRRSLRTGLYVTHCLFSSFPVCAS